MRPPVSTLGVADASSARSDIEAITAAGRASAALTPGDFHKGTVLTAANLNMHDGLSNGLVPMHRAESVSEDSLGDLPSLCDGCSDSSREPCVLGGPTPDGSDTEEEEGDVEPLSAAETLSCIATLASGLPRPNESSRPSDLSPREAMRDEVDLDAPAKRYRVCTKLPQDNLFVAPALRGNLSFSPPEPRSSASPHLHWGFWWPIPNPALACCAGLGSQGWAHTGMQKCAELAHLPSSNGAQDSSHHTCTGDLLQSQAS